MATQIESDASSVLSVLAEWSQGPSDTQKGRYSLDGNEIMSATSLIPERINDAVEVLRSSGYVATDEHLGTAPFDFACVELTPKGRLAHQRAADEDRKKPQATEEIANMPEPDKQKVFIIHGRNIAARIAVEHFLRALGLDPIDFDRLAADQGGTAFIGDIVRAGLEQAQGIIALFTPDEFAALRPDHRGPHEKGEDVLRWQSRPNVIFEAGMAYGLAPKRTILVTLGTDVSLFSDVGGVHIVRLRNDVPSRSRLRQKLVGMGCRIDERADSWTDHTRSGDFETCVNALAGVSPRDPFL